MYKNPPPSSPGPGGRGDGHPPFHDAAHRRPAQDGRTGQGRGFPSAWAVIYRRIGETGISASALGLGCSRLGSVASGVSGTAAHRLLDEAFDLGINFYDTADSYGQGESETLIGKVFRRKRDRIVITTKVGYRLRGMVPLLLAVKPLLRPVLRRLRAARTVALGVRPAAMGIDFNPGYIRRAIEKSLRRLRTEYIDFYLLHNPPLEVTRDGAVLELLTSLQGSGKIRYYGLSCTSAEPGLAALENPGMRAIEFPLSPASATSYQALLAASARRSVGIFATQPFAAGAALGLSGTTDGRHGSATLAEAARDLGVSPVQLLLQFALQCKGVSIVLAGTTSSAHLQENVRAVTDRPLPPGLFDSVPSA